MEDATDGALYAGIWLKAVGHIDECNLQRSAAGSYNVEIVKSVGFAYASAHFNAVDGMAQFSLRHRDEKLDALLLWGVSSGPHRT